MAKRSIQPAIAPPPLVGDLDSVEVCLGEKTFRLHALGLAVSEQWRAGFEGEVRSVLEAVQQQVGAFDTADLRQMDIGALLPVIMQLLGRVNGALAAAAEMVITYSPETEADREYLRARATTRQVIVALLEVVKLEYPFQGLLSRRSPNGRSGGMTSKS